MLGLLKFFIHTIIKPQTELTTSHEESEYQGSIESLLNRVEDLDRSVAQAIETRKYKTHILRDGRLATVLTPSVEDLGLSTVNGQLNIIHLLCRVVIIDGYQMSLTTLKDITVPDFQKLHSLLAESLEEQA